MAHPLRRTRHPHRREGTGLALTLVSSSLGPALHNCRTFEAVQVQRNKAAMVLAMIRPLGAAELVPERLVGLILKHMRQVTGAEKCCLFILDTASSCLQGLVGVDQKVTLRLDNNIPGIVAAKGTSISAQCACEHPRCMDGDCRCCCGSGFAWLRSRLRPACCCSCSFAGICD